MDTPSVISNSVLFSSLSDEQRYQLSSIAKTCSYPNGYTVFKQGDTITDLYEIRSGRIQLVTEMKLWNQDWTLHSQVESLGTGDIFGGHL